MKKIRSPRGKGFVVALLAIAFGCVTAYTTKEVIIGTDGSLSAKLGPAFNKILLGASKLGMGLSELHTPGKSAASETPEGMIVSTSDAKASVSRPSGIVRKGEDQSLVGKSSMELRKVSHRAFISASKIEIYAK